jgi:hypothetical protein
MCQPVTLASELPYPYRVAVDATAVYFTVFGTYSASSEVNFDGMLCSVPKEGGPVSVLTQGGLVAWGLAVDASNLYMSFAAQNYTALYMYPKAGGVAVHLSSSSTNYMALDVNDANATASRVFFRDNDAVVAVTPGSAGVELAKVGTAVAGVATTGSEVVFGGAGDWDATGAPLGNGVLMKVSMSGGNTSTLDANAGSPYAVAADDTHAYYTDLFGHRVMRASMDGSSVAAIATGQSHPYGVVVDGEYVYWTNRGAGYWNKAMSCGGSGSLMRAPRGGGMVEVLAEGLDCPAWLVQDDASLYWVEQGTNPYQSTGDGRIARIAK